MERQSSSKAVIIFKFSSVTRFVLKIWRKSKHDYISYNILYEYMESLKFSKIILYWKLQNIQCSYMKQNKSHQWILKIIFISSHMTAGIYLLCVQKTKIHFICLSGKRILEHFRAVLHTKYLPDSFLQQQAVKSLILTWHLNLRHCPTKIM